MPEIKKKDDKITIMIKFKPSTTTIITMDVDWVFMKFESR
jgi:hypothetical protein